MGNVIINSCYVYNAASYRVGKNQPEEPLTNSTMILLELLLLLLLLLPFVNLNHLPGMLSS